MIRIVKLIKARSTAAASQFRQLPMIPASGTLATATEETETGLKVKNSISARLESSAAVLHDLLYDDLVLMLEFEDGSIAYVGSDDVPVHLKINEGDTLDISAEHVCGVR